MKAKTIKGKLNMKKQNIKSILTNARLRLVAATCLILAALGLPTAELVRASGGRGGPPQPITRHGIYSRLRVWLSRSSDSHRKARGD